MALNDVPLNDAGGDYYARQFGSRVQNIRKYGATPPTQRKGGCLGGGAVGGIFAVIVLMRIIAAVGSVGSSGYNSNYNTYNPPNITIPDPPPPPIDWQKNIQIDPPVDPNMPNGNPPLWQPGQPIVLPPLDPPDARPDDPLIRPDPPVVAPDDPPAVPDPKPPVAPGDDKPGDDK